MPRTTKPASQFREGLPEYEIISLAYEQLVNDEGTCLVATILCERQGCGQVFKVDWEAWSSPHLSELKGYEIIGRSCPYCMSTRKVPFKKGHELWRAISSQA